MTRRALLAIIVLLGTAIALQDRLPDWVHDSRYWWRTPDQVAAVLYADGQFAQAAGHFRSPAWRGVACYRAADLACADAAFAQAALVPEQAAEAAFNRGNVAAKAGRLNDAVAQFDLALAARADWPAARDNRALVLAALAARQRQKQDRATGHEPTEPPDGTVMDEKGKAGKPGTIAVEKLDTDALAKLWLRNVRSDPGEFLRLRFAQEARQSDEGVSAR